MTLLEQFRAVFRLLLERSSPTSIAAALDRLAERLEAYGRR